MSRVGVFPASGGLGTSIVSHLAKAVPASQLTLIARHPDKLTKLSHAGATVRQADYDEPHTLEHAFDGVDTLMLISYASVEIEYRFEAHKRAITAARRSGVSHIFYSSLAFGGDLQKTSIAHVMGAHLRTERYLSELPGPATYTAIREGHYTECFPVYTAFFDLHNPVEEIAIPHSGDGPGVSWVKRDELGEATAKMILSYVKSSKEFPYLNKVLLLSGPEPISLKDTVAILGRVIGKPVRIREVSADEYAALPQVEGRFTYHEQDLSRDFTTVWEAFRRGEAAAVAPLLGELLEREPEGFETTVRGLLQD